MHIQLQGFYTVRRVKRDSGAIVQQVGPFANDIMDAGLDRIGTSSAISRCYVGQGTAPPDPLVPAMSAWLASTSTQSGSVQERDPTNTTYWVQSTITFRFAEGVAAGNLTEVGVGWHTNNSTNPAGAVWSRQLIRDAAGNPTSITVLADEFLDVSYTLRHYPQLGDITAEFMISGVPYEATLRPRHVTAWLMNMGASQRSPATLSAYRDASLSSITSTNVGGTAIAQGTSTNTLGTYVPGSYRTESTHTWSLTDGNHANGITGFNYSGTGSNTLIFNPSYQILLDRPIMKTADRILVLNTRLSWGRYTP